MRRASWWGIRATVVLALGFAGAGLAGPGAASARHDGVRAGNRAPRAGAPEDPLRIEPRVWVQDSRLDPSDGADIDGVGYAVALSGDTALVGAYQHDTARGEDAGAVYVFVRSGTTWTETARLEASDGAARDWFGLSVAIAGDVAIVGAPQHDTARAADAGAAYVFVRSGTTWTETARLEASDGTFSAAFGNAVAIDGSTALVGARSADSARASNSGAAYVFVERGAGWSLEAKLEAGDGEDGDALGVAVALSGDTALLGANGDTTARGFGAGSAYVFVRSGATWSAQAKLEASDASASDVFGYSVSLDGDTAAVGALYDDTPQGTDAGSAYVFVRSGTSWTQEVRLSPSDGARGDFFGHAVAVQGDTLLVGAPYHSPPAGLNAGSAYVYVRRGSAWAFVSRLDARDGAATDQLGRAVALDGDTALVGAFLAGTGAGVDVGAAYTFVPRLDDGARCADGAACGSGFCVDGVCCDAACGGGAPDDCEACSVAAGARLDGVCADTSGNACSDASACTTEDVCAAGVCVGGATPCRSGTLCATTDLGFTCGPCPAGTASLDGTGLTDCVPCAEGTYAEAGASACAAWAECGAGEFEAAAPSAASDRRCAACSVCAAGEREVAPCAARADTVCEPSGDGGASADAGTSPDAPMGADAGTARDGGAALDAGAPGAAPASGCQCAAAAHDRGRGAGPLLGALGLVLALAARRRARLPAARSAPRGATDRTARRGLS